MVGSLGVVGTTLGGVVGMLSVGVSVVSATASKAGCAAGALAPPSSACCASARSAATVKWSRQSISWRSHESAQSHPPKRGEQGLVAPHSYGQVWPPRHQAAMDAAVVSGGA